MRRLRLLSGLLAIMLFGAAIAHASPRPELPAVIPEKQVVEISFRSDHSLTFAELTGKMPLKIGDVLTREKLEKSLDALFVRDIFVHIDLILTETEDGVKVEFVLVPALLVFELRFGGNHALDDKQLRRLAGLRLGEKLNFDHLLEAKRRLEAGYKREGYYQTKIEANVSERIVASQVIVRFEIEEGYRSRFGIVNVLGELPADLESVRARFQDDIAGLAATDDKLKDLRKELLLAVRNEGYLQASVEVVSAELNQLSGDIDLTVKLDPQAPLSIVFSGNTLFTPEDLLHPLRLESRTVPFTPSAIQTLCKEIRKMYQAEGYFFAVCESTELEKAGDRRRYEVRITEGRRVRLGKLSFAGNTAFGDAELLRLIETRKAGPALVRPLRPGYLRSDVLSTDLAALELFYQQAGYFDAKVSFELSSEEDPDWLNLLITIEEGPQTVLSDVQLRWKGVAPNLTPDETALLELSSTLKAGDPFQGPKFKEEQVRLTSEVIKLGYPSASITIEADHETGALVFTVDSGPNVRVGDIWLAGNTTISDRLIARELRFESGDLLVPDELRESEQLLFRSGYFKNVQITPTDGTLDETTEDLTVHVSERDTGWFEIGAAVNSEDGVHLFGELGQRNLGGAGRSVVMGIDGFFKTGSRLFDAGNARILLTEPHVLNSRAEWLNELFVQYSIEVIDPFSYDRLGGSTSIRYPITEKFFGSFGATAYYEHLFDVEPDVILGPDDEGNGFFSFFHGQLEVDQRDNAYNPRSGYRTVLQARLNSEVIGASANFAALYFQHSTFHPLGTRTVWANNVRANYLDPFSGTEVIPLSQRIALGGRNSLRGFSLYSVGPRGTLGNIVGGDSSVNLNSELQYDLTENTVGVVFLDLGQAFLENEGTFTEDELGLNDMRYSPGFGLRYVTPIGPISAELGFNPDREEGERWGRFNFSVGGAF